MSLEIPDIDYRLIILMSDQPTTCRKCGTGTDMLSDLTHTNANVQIEQCLNPRCKYIFLLQEDDGETY